MSFPVFGSFYQKLLWLLPLASKSFNYDNSQQWFIDFPQCLGFKQSPISILTHKSVPVSLPPLLFGYYDEFLDDFMHVHNNGHTVELKVPTTLIGAKPYIGFLEHIYEAESVHFHWGSAAQKGSEHMLNERRYDLEMHIVHKNVKYNSLEMARDFEDGIAVLAVLFKLVMSPNVFYPGLNEIYNTLDNVVKYNSTASTQNLITLGSLLADMDREDFYTYSGSLTTPPCSESVTWFVFPDILPISYTALPKFWQLLTEHGKELKNNFRHIQALDHRQVYHRKPVINYEF